MDVQFCCSTDLEYSELMSNEWAMNSFVHGINIVYIKPLKAQLEGISYYPNPYPNIRKVGKTPTGKDRAASSPTIARLVEFL